MKNRQPFRRRQVVQIKNRDGRFEIPHMGAWHTYWADPYHLLLTIPWWGFGAMVTALYLLINTLFALAYMVVGGLSGARPGNFADAFFFSVQTLASIGYGAIHPIGPLAHILVTIEAIASLLLIAVVTGIAYARFSRPVAKVMFSNVAVITPYNGQPTLMFRLANERRNIIIEAQLQVYLLTDETSQEGQFMRRFSELTLVRQRTPALSLTWTAMHIIDINSPLYGYDATALATTHGLLQVSLVGIDEAVAYTISARHTYSSQEILFNERFVDILTPQPNGDRYIDYRHFHHTQSID